MVTNLQGSSHRPRAVGFRLRNRKNFIYEDSARLIAENLYIRSDGGRLCHTYDGSLYMIMAMLLYIKEKKIKGGISAVNDLFFNRTHISNLINIQYLPPDL